MTLSNVFHASDTPLTARETEILDFIARGFTSKQIARELNISPYTVNTHRDNLRRKLGAHNGAQLASCRATLRSGDAPQAAMASKF
jgi:DNA-binding NarL/FixJ family response regulator